MSRCRLPIESATDRCTPLGKLFEMAEDVPDLLKGLRLLIERYVYVCLAYPAKFFAPIPTRKTRKNRLPRELLPLGAVLQRSGETDTFLVNELPYLRF